MTEKDWYYEIAESYGLPHRPVSTLFDKVPSIKREHTVTITNHIRRIEDLAGQVIAHVDDRKYAEAHEDLDFIEVRVRLAHRHIDHLQNVTDFCARPAGGDGT